MGISDAGRRSIVRLFRINTRREGHDGTIRLAASVQIIPWNAPSRRATEIHRMPRFSQEVRLPGPAP